MPYPIPGILAFVFVFTLTSPFVSELFAITIFFACGLYTIKVAFVVAVSSAWQLVLSKSFQVPLSLNARSLQNCHAVTHANIDHTGRTHQHIRDRCGQTVPGDLADLRA